VSAGKEGNVQRRSWLFFEKRLPRRKEVIGMKVEGTNIRHVMSASTLIGDKVVNEAGEDLGKVEEIMLHVPSGRIAYAVLSFGGFLGMGDKLFAIPWEALKLNEESKCFVLGVDKERLKNAPGFDKNNWPDMASQVE
jgi:sporulation protein YlmC with PRC-barrel domain